MILRRARTALRNPARSLADVAGDGGPLRTTLPKWQITAQHGHAHLAKGIGKCDQQRALAISAGPMCQDNTRASVRERAMQESPDILIFEWRRVASRHGEGGAT